MLAKTLAGELSARPTPGDIAGILNIQTHTHTHTHTTTRGMLVASFMLTILD